MSARSKRLRLALPKGSLQETTGKLFALAGYQVRFSERSYYPEIDDPEIECILIRAQEMARYVDQGVLDAGITGFDWTMENRAKVKELADLKAPWPNYGPVRWVVAVKNDSKIRKPKDLEGKRVGAIVVAVPAVAFYASPLNSVRLRNVIELLPQIDVFNRLFIGGAPTISLPSRQPLSGAVHDVF